MTLSDGSGLDVAEALRALPSGRRPRVIGMSGWHPSAQMVAAFDAFVEKPAMESDLRRLLDQIAATTDG